MSSPKTVLILGASGYVGRAVAEHLRERGSRVVAVQRPGSASELPAGVEVRPGDLTDPASLTTAVTPDVDAVIHVANPTGDEAVDAAALDALLAPLRGTGRAFVYTSGVWVLGATDDRVADETTPVNPIPLVAYRPRLERAVLDAAADGVRAIVLRPGVVYGRGGGIPAMFVGLAAQRDAGTYVGDGARWPMVHLDDLAELYGLVLDRAEPGALLHGVSEPAVDTRALAEVAATAAGVRGVSAWPLAAAREVLGAAFADALALDQAVSAERTAAALGWAPTRLDPLTEIGTGSYRAAPAA